MECTANSDTVCPLCPSASDELYLGNPNVLSGLQYCKKSDTTGEQMVRCEKFGDDDPVGSSTCGEWSEKHPDVPTPQCVDENAHPERMQECGKWISYCEHEHIGKSCCYHAHTGGCGAEPSRTRSANKNVYNAEAGGNVEDFCRVLCDGFKDCMAFEVDHGDAGANVYNEKEPPTCLFFAGYTQMDGKWRDHKSSKTCFSNTCRQNTYQVTGLGENQRVIMYDFELK